MAVRGHLRGGSPRLQQALVLILVVGLIWFFFVPNSETAIDLVRQRKVDAAAENPLSPPTSAFKKQPSLGDGKRAVPPVVHYDLNSLTATSNPIENKERVLILTPLARFYPEFWENLVKLTFPHELITVAFIIPRNKEGNAATTALQKAIQETQAGPENERFQSIVILRQDFDNPLSSQDEKERHKMSNQAARRKSMAQARNSLLFPTIGPQTSWVLWLDSDIVETPHSLIQDLASHNKPIIVPNCFQRYYNEDTKSMDIRPYDYNSWRDSAAAQSLAQSMGPDEILLEGYAEMPTYRTLMAMTADTSRDGKDLSRIEPLDGVGGTALLVKAEVHRDGAMFPPFPFYHLVETEGFAKMARRLGWESFGLPNYFVSLISPIYLALYLFPKLKTDGTLCRCIITTSERKLAGVATK